MDKQDYIVEWNMKWQLVLPTGTLLDSCAGLELKNLGLCRDAGKATGNYLVGFRV